MFASKEFEDRLLAKLFGFPQCCVDFYVNTPSEELRRAPGIAHAGIRLCPACATKDLEAVVNGIAERRICPTPFPITPKESDFRAIIEDQRFTEQERAWLLANKSRVVPSEDPFDAALMALHQGLTDLDERTAENIAAEPERANLFLAQQEIAKREMLGAVLNGIHAAMKKRVIEQIKGGHLKI